MDKRATILVVDDEYGVRQSFNMVLKDAYHVLLAGIGQEAIEIFTKNSVDLILLDILLPDMDGLDLLKKRHPSASESLFGAPCEEYREAPEKILQNWDQCLNEI